MTSLKVKFIDESKILNVKDYPIRNSLALLGCGVESLLKQENKPLSDNSINYLPPIQEDELAAQDSVIYCKPTELVESEKENLKFGFQTPNKQGNMLGKADSAIKTKYFGSPQTPKTPKTPKGNATPKTPRTPTTPRTPRTKRATSKTPLSKTGNLSCNQSWTPRRLLVSETPETPYALRRTIKKRIANVINDDSDDFDDSDEDQNYSPSNSEEDSATDDTEEENFTIEEKTPIKGLKGAKKTPLKFFDKRLPQTPLRTPRRGREFKVDIDMVASTDDYFAHNSELNSGLTSDHTLNRLEKPRLGPEALKSMLEGTMEYHQKERTELIEDHRTLFPHWITLLSEGFNIFLCGVGSKKYLLSLFQEEILCSFDHLVVNGFFPSLTIKSILVSILEEILELSTYPIGFVDQLKILANYYNDPSYDPLFLIINNLDGPMLRNEKAQSVLSQLASFKNVHIIASLDHINSPLIFDGNKYSLYNPLWWDATTLAPYTEETSYENSLLVQQTGDLALSSLLHVFKSLTPNAKGIFILLAKYQLSEKSSNSNYIGMSFGDLYQRCRESFLVNSDLTLRAQLTEFKDHKLIKLKKGFDGSENLIISLEDSTLQEFLDQYEEL